MLHRELEDLGWRGGLRTVERYVAQLRERTDPPPITPTPPKPRKVAAWIMSDPDHLSDGTTVQLQGIPSPASPNWRPPATTSAPSPT